MSTVLRRKVARTFERERDTGNLTVIELIQPIPNRFQWRGNDGFFYSQRYTSKTLAISAARSGSLRKQ